MPPGSSRQSGVGSPWMGAFGAVCHGQGNLSLTLLYNCRPTKSVGSHSPVLK